jgi:ketosteroid isomerase-like protein
LRFRAQYSDAWERVRFDVDDVIDAGESVVLLTHNTGTARSGVRLSVRVCHVLTLSRGKIVRWQYFGEEPTEALKAVGMQA